VAIKAADLLVNVRADVDRAQRNLQRVDDRLDKIGKKTFPVAAKAAKAFGIAAVAGFGVLGSQAVTGAILGFTASVSAMVGALAAVPGALAALVGIFATVKIGLLGIGDAMKTLGGTAEEFAEGIKDLAPSAQGFMKALRGMRDEAKALRLGVQQELFRGLGKEVQALGGVYLPMLKDRLSEIAGALNQGTREFSRMLRQGNRVADVSALLSGTRGAALGLMRGVRNIVEAFLDLARGGQRSLDGIGASIERVTGRFAAWAKAAREAGDVQRWIDTGFAALKAFGEVLGNIGSIFSGVFRAMEGSASGPFGTLKEITGGLADLVNSVAGQDALRSFFASASQAATALMPVIGGVFDLIKNLAPVLANIATGIGPGLTDFLKALGAEFGTLGGEGSSLGEALGEFLRSLIPVIPMVGDLIRMIVRAVQVLAPFGPALLALAGALYGVKAALAVTKAVGAFTSGLGLLGGGLSKALLHSRYFAAGLTSSQAAASAFTGRMGTIGGALRTMAASMVSGIATAARWAASMVAAGARVAASAVRAAVAFAATAARVVASWVLMGVQAMIQAARMAAAWLLAMGPVGWVIAAVIALVALIIANWDTVKRVTVEVWDAVWSKIKQVWEVIVAAVTGYLNVLWTVIKAVLTQIVTVFRALWNLGLGIVKTAWQAIVSVVTGYLNAMRNIVSGVLNVIKGLFSGNFQQVLAGVRQIMGGLIGFMTTITRAILGALGNLGGLLWNAGRSIIQGLVNGVRSMAGAVKDAVAGVLRSARNLLPFSPAKEGPFSGKGWTLYSGQSISEALAQGLKNRTDEVRKAALGAAKAAAGPLEGLTTGGAPAGAPGAVQRAPRPRTPDDLARPASGGNALALTFVTHNPVAEPQSVTTNKALNRAGALGLVG
jgi:phage-related protein